jgi:hypothetical protein
MLQTGMMEDPHGDLAVNHALTTRASAPLQANLASTGATLSEPYADIIETLPPTASRYPRSEVEAFIEALACGTLPRTKAYRKIRQDMGISKCVSCRAIKPFACQMSSRSPHRRVTGDTPHAHSAALFTSAHTGEPAQWRPQQSCLT